VEKLKQVLGAEIRDAVDRAAALHGWPSVTMPEVSWEYPPEPAFGDLSTTVSFALAKQVRRSPRDVATAIQQAISIDPGVVAKVEVAGPGYLNFFVASAWWHAVIRGVLAAGPAYGRATVGQGQRVQVEFVSANPTGPLHVGHGRGAALGDAIASLLEAVGFRVEREYYINDAGSQMRLLGESVWARLREARGAPVQFPENGYHGEYVRELAAQVAQAVPGLGDADPDRAIPVCVDRASKILLEEIEADLRAFGVTFDAWVSERSLYESGEVDAALATLRAGGYLYEEGKAVGFRASDLVTRRTAFSSGATENPLTLPRHRLPRQQDPPRVPPAHQYLGGSRRLHPSVKAPSKRWATTGDPPRDPAPAGEGSSRRRAGPDVETDRGVRGASGGRERGGEGRRPLPLSHPPLESQLDFDIEVAKRQTMDNPVFYVQYAHARACSMARKAADSGLPGPYDAADISQLTLAEELGILKQLAKYPETLLNAALAYEPHRVTTFLQELAAAFHGYFTKYKDSEERVISGDRHLSRARLAMVGTVRQVVANGLAILGVSAPERM
jgi:arginyl-tRNA synthetase